MTDINDIIEWDVLNWSQLIHYWNPIIEKLPKDSKILAIGERNGGLSLWLALNGFHVICSDREGPTSKGIEIHRKYDILDRISYISYDVVNNSYLNNKYDLIIAKSLLGGLKIKYDDASTRNHKTRELAIKNIYSLLNQNGYVLFAENMKGSQLLNLVRMLLGKHKGWYYFTIYDIQKLFSNFSDLEIKAFGILPTNYSNKHVNKVFYLLNKYIFDYLPASFKYVGFIKAQKL